MVDWQMTAIKRRWIPEWLFAIVVHGCRVFDTDLAQIPRLRRWMVTEDFHYHDLGRAVYGKQCRRCLPVQTLEHCASADCVYGILSNYPCKCKCGMCRTLNEQRH